MKVFKEFRSPSVFMGDDSICALKSELRKGDGSINVFILDSFFPSSVAYEKLFAKQADIVICESTENEPKTGQVDDLVEKIKEVNVSDIKNVVGFGGGSILDLAKGVSVLLTNPGKTEDYQGWDKVKVNPVRKIGVPTLSGTGSEVSRTAVFTSPTKKQGINSLHSMFNTIILDPQFTNSVSNEQRFFTAMDSYIHSVEAITGSYINSFAAAQATQSIDLCKKVFLDDGTNEDLMVASLMGGFSIIHSEVGLVHALSYGLSFGYGIHHGEANCIIFNKMDDYYSEYLPAFRAMLDTNQIELRTGITANASNEKLEKMVDVCLTMEKPLENALGPDWRSIMNREKVKELLKAY